MILIADNAEVNRQLLAECFQKDYAVIFARDGRETIRKIEEYNQRLAAILLDIVMPVMDGIAVLRWMAERPYCAIPAIVVTAEARCQLEALRSGAWDFITKPVENEVIRARVENVLSRYALANEHQRSARLFEKQREMRHLVNSIPGGIAIYRLADSRFETLYFSDGVAQLSGYTREEYLRRVGRDASSVVYEEDRKRLIDSAVKTLKNGLPIDETYRIYHKDGGLVWVRLTGIPLGSRDGAPLIHAVFQRPPRMAQLYGNLVNESKNVIYVSDIHNYDLLYLNHTGLRAIGKETADYSNQKCYEFLFGRTAPCPFCRIREMNPTTYLERDFVYPINGRIYAMRGKLTDWNGIPAHVEYAQDITEQREMERKNAALLRQLQSVMEHIPGGMCVYRVDSDGIYPLVHNQAFFDIFGYSARHRNDVLTDTRFLNVHPDDLPQLQQAIGTAIRSGARLDATYRSFHDIRNAYIWINMKGVVVSQGSGEKLCYVSYNDVTAERQAQEQLVRIQRELQDNQLRYETAIKSTSINIWEYDIQQDVLYVISNSFRIKQDCYRIEQYEETMLKNGSVREDSIPRFRQIFQRLRQGESPITEDIWCRGTDEAGWWCERVTYTTAFGPGGRPLKAYGAGRDVTAEKIAEQKFHEELAYRKAMQNENAASVMVDLTENLVLEADGPYRTIRQHLGSTADAYFAKTAEMLTGEAHRKKYHALFDRKTLLNDYNNGELSKTMETTRLYDTNKVYWIRYSVHLIQNPETKHVMGHVTCTDVTREKVMQTIMETVAATDYDRFIVVDGSSNSAQDYGVAEEDRIFSEQLPFEQQSEAWIRSCVCPEDLDRVIAECRVDSVWSHVKYGKPYKFSFNMRMRDGTVRHKQMQFTKISGPRRTYLVSLVDVSDIYEEQEAAKRELQRALGDAERANRVKTDFLSRMSHDIRTPMNAVLALSALGRDSTDLEETRDYLRKIESSGQYLLAIINDVLNLSKMENRGIVLRPETVFLPAFIESTMAIVTPTARKKNIALKLTQTGITARYIKLDTTYVRQVVVNLLSNAIKFTPSGGMVELGLENLSREDRFVKNRITVRDNGIGISPEFLPRVFTPFEQENTQNDLSRQGTGLGLSIVREIVEQMHGKIWAESVKGRGSTFYVEWTFETAPEPGPDQNRQSAELPDPEVLRNAKILLAEDHPLNAQIAVKLLEKKGALVERAENGRLAADRFSASACGYYDAVLMDIRMPVMNGLEAARAIRELHRPDAKTVPIIAMTANAFDDDVRSALAAGMNAHLAKPIEPQKLYKTLAELIRESR
jgi:PAS domain S-box-containing protein